MKNFIFYLVFVFFVLFLDAKDNRQELSDGYSIVLLSGDSIQPILSFIEQMRLSYFREYPYLYEGTLQEERVYSAWFSKLKDSMVAVVYYNNKPVGFLTGTSFVDFSEHYTGSLTLFRNAGLDPEQYYYFGEVIIQKEHRGNSLSRKLFELLEQYVRDLGYTKTCLVTESHKTHPCKPTDYRELDGLWIRLGYIKTSAGITFKWNTLQVNGTKERQEHVLMYWIKDLVG